NKAGQLRYGEGPREVTTEARDPEVRVERVTADYRVCDLVAVNINAWFPAAPRCELYWPQERRDAAVAACLPLLKQSGPTLPHRNLHFPLRRRPAKADDIAKGRAIFTLDQDKERVRLVPLKLPRPAVWTTLKERLVEKEVYDHKTATSHRVRSYLQQGV